MVEFIAVILAVAIGTGIFILMNSFFDITYFGCGAIVTLWFACFGITYLIVVQMVGPILGILKWIIIGGIGLTIFGALGSSKNK